MTTRRIVVDALQVSREPTGVGRQALAVGEALRDLPDGLQLELRCAKDTAPLLAASFPKTTRVVTPVRSSRPRSRRILVQQLRALRDGRDVLHVALGDQVPLMGRARLIAVVNDVRRLTTQSEADRLERLWYRLLVRRAVKRADVLLTISRFSRDELERIFGRKATIVDQHPAVTVNASSERADDAPLLVVGAVRPYKGLDTLVEALALMPAAQRPRVVVAGPSDRTGAAILQQARAAGVERSLELLGWVDDQRLNDLYNEARALVAPSRYEGYDLPVAEALAHGLPVVASDIPPHVEVGGGAVLRFPVGDAAALAQALQTLADPQRRRELSAAALARAQALASSNDVGWREAILGAVAQ